ncbi:phasin family protein [Methylocystis sp. JAN1]|uniref:phasin family protein n=1 Tax=Methylocystis sp. JAN1 TaxID=3397211 RepID=UPI003FA295CE
MAKNSKGGSQSNSVDAGQEIPDAAPAETTLAGAPAGHDEGTVEPVVANEAASPEPAAEIADIVSAPLAIVDEAVETATEGFAAAFSFDSSEWSKKSLELWSEHAAAFFAFAEQLSRAQTFEEIVDLQSRFASERFEAFLRQSKELMDVAKSIATVTAAPLCDARRAA